MSSGTPRMKYSPHTVLTQGTVLMQPVLEKLLGEDYRRAEAHRRMQENRPLIAVIGGSPDHPATIRDAEVTRLAAKAIWKRGAVPFAVMMPVICDGVAQGHLGMSYSLLSRNRTSAEILGLMQAHHYHAALVLQSCDKQPSALVAGLAELDLLRQRAGEDPVCAVFLPSNVMRPGDVPPEVKAELERIVKKAPQSLGHIAQAIRDILREPLTCAISAGWQKNFDELEHHGLITTEERARLESRIYQLTCPYGGGMCAFLGTANSSRMVTAALGLVPSGLELLTQPPGPSEVDAAAEALFDCITKARSIATLVRANLRTAVKVWSTTGGSTNLALHLPFVMNSLGIRGDLDRLLALQGTLPQYFALDLPEGRSVWTLAEQCHAGKISGVDTLVKVLAADSHLSADDLNAPTVTGTWRQRIRTALMPEAKLSPGESIIRRRPVLADSGIHKLTGNLCRSAVVKITGLKPEQVDDFDDKVFVALYYIGEEEVIAALRDTQGLLESLKRNRRIGKARLLAAARRNFRLKRREFARLDKASVAGVWDRLIAAEQLRMMIVVAGQGPRAFGMPEMFTFTEYINVDPVLRKCCTTFTDGRISGATYGSVIVHSEPEAADGGPILYLETGDLIHLRLREGTINVIEAAALCQSGKVKPVKRAALEAERLSLANRRWRQVIRRMNRFDSHTKNELSHLTGTYYGAVPETMVEVG